MIHKDTLQTIWQNVLEVEQVSDEDDFFQLGGESVKAAMILNRVLEELDVEISIVDFFDEATFAGLVKLVAEASK